MEILQVRFAAQMQQTRDLFREYFGFLRRDHGLDISYQGVAEELAALPGEFAPPRGRLIIAIDSGKAAGCAAFRPLRANTCEMKRMYVLPEFRGRGVGRSLAERLIQEARQIGYEYMRLDTANLLVAAISLYESLGFRPIVPYNEVPEELQSVAVHMELVL